MTIGQKQIEFLGTIIENGEIRLQPNIIKKIIEKQETDLTTKSGLRSWLGILNYARNFIPNLGKLLAPLYGKTSPTGEKKFNQQDWALVRQVKEQVQNLPALTMPPTKCDGVSFNAQATLHGPDEIVANDHGELFKIRRKVLEEELITEILVFLPKFVKGRRLLRRMLCWLNGDVLLEIVGAAEIAGHNEATWAADSCPCDCFPFAAYASWVLYLVVVLPFMATGHLFWRQLDLRAVASVNFS
ncbi:hypothetical protein EJ110_NYTH58965 [Nymphaea thermarum]|nr:hypothetical protein EJ110_NYTH58965 [Nymphaea thermarum]